MAQKIFSLKYIAALLLTVGILILGGLNAEQKRKYIAPDDGVSWIETSNGIEARLVVPDGPADKAGIHRGDVLKAIEGQEIQNDRHVTQILYGLGVWSRATFLVERNGKEFDTTLVIAPPPPQFLPAGDPQARCLGGEESGRGRRRPGRMEDENQACRRLARLQTAANGGDGHSCRSSSDSERRVIDRI